MFYDKNPLDETRSAFIKTLGERTVSPRVMQIQSRVLEAIAKEYHFNEILNEVCFLIEASCDNGLCSVLLLDPGTQALRPGVGPSLPDGALDALTGLPVAMNSGSCGTAAFTRTMAIVEDTSIDPRWAAPTFQSFACNFGVKSCWSHPFFDSEERVLGTFAISRTVVGAPSDEELALLVSAAHLTSIAVVQERTREELRKAHAKLREVLGTNGSTSQGADAGGSEDALLRARRILFRLTDHLPNPHHS